MVCRLSGFGRPEGAGCIAAHDAETHVGFDIQGCGLYHAAFMSEQFVIDNLRFAESGESLRQRMPVARFPRLVSQLADDSGEVRFTLRGGRTQFDRPALFLTVEAEVKVACQRCMGPLPVTVESESVLPVAKNEAQLEDYDSDEEDAILADAQFNVLDLIEDEVLLSLPLAPRHDRCVELPREGADEKPNPFAVLAKLKKH